MKIQTDLNPWLSIWTKPKETIRAIVSLNPNHRLFYLSGIYGLIALWSFAQTYSIGLYLGFYPLLILCLIIAPFWGYVVFSASSFVIWIVGKWIGGKAPFTHVRSALAWSNVPQVVNVLMWILMIVIIGPTLFLGFPDSVQISQPLLAILFPILIIQLVISIWSVIIYIGALSAVQQFSIFRSFINVLLSFLIIGAIVLGIVYLLMFFGAADMAAYIKL